MKQFNTVVESSQMLSGLLSKKIAVPAIIVLGFVVGIASPFWFTGGFVNNMRLAKNQTISINRGWGLGSKTVFARAGQTIRVDVDVQEVRQGSMNVYLRRDIFAGIPGKKDSAHVSVHSPGKKSLKLKATQTGLYKLSFTPHGEFHNKVDMFTGGKCDIVYSAKWKVQ